MRPIGQRETVVSNGGPTFFRHRFSTKPVDESLSAKVAPYEQTGSSYLTENQMRPTDILPEQEAARKSCEGSK